MNAITAIFQHIFFTQESSAIEKLIMFDYEKSAVTPMISLPPELSLNEWVCEYFCSLKNFNESDLARKLQ